MPQPSETLNQQATVLMDRANRMRRNAQSELVALSDPDEGIVQPFLDRVLEWMEDPHAYDMIERVAALRREYENDYDEMGRRTRALIEASDDAEVRKRLIRSRIRWDRWFMHLGIYEAMHSSAAELDQASKALHDAAAEFEAAGM